MWRLKGEQLALVLCLGLTACGSGGDEDPAPTFSVHEETAKDSKINAADGGVNLTSDATAVADSADPAEVQQDVASGPCQGDDGCPTEQFCLNGKCLPDICSGGTAKCANLTRRSVCKSNGAGYTSTDCKTGESCEDGVCKPEVCKPGLKVCAENKVITCSSRGVSWTEAVDCGDQATCVEGQCVSLLCKGGETKCAGATLMTCEADGMGWLTAPCANDQSCDGAAAKPACVAQLCKPDADFCKGDKAMSCNANGLKMSEIADCGQPDAQGKKQKCLSGKCVPYGCVPGAKICQDGMVGTCVDNGGGYSLQPCANGQTCDGGQCIVMVCVPGETLCDGKLIKTCIADGSALAVASKCGDKQTCVGKQGKAECVEQTCTPGEKTCSNDNSSVQTCKPDGLATTLSKCPLEDVCDKGACTKKLCDPAAKFCSVDWVMQCNPVGSGADKVVQCTDKLVCKDGACLNKLCNVGVATCKNATTLSVCADATKGMVDEPCVVGKVCNGGKCVDQVCVPGSKFCEGSQLFVCDAAGLSKLMNIDCVFQNKACVDGECKAPVCGNGKVEPGEQCDDGNNSADDGCGPTCLKEVPKQCKPSQKCCSETGMWLPKGEKCGTFGLLKKFKCSSTNKGAWIMVSEGFASCTGNSDNCDYLHLWYAPHKNQTKCDGDEYCKIGPITGYPTCSK